MNESIELAQKIKTLIAFCGALIPHKETLKGLLDRAEDREGSVQAMAPLFGAFDIDPEKKAVQARLHSRRAKALYDLVVVLAETEAERQEYENKKNDIKETKKMLEKF